MSAEHVAVKAVEALAGGTLVIASAGLMPLVVALPAAIFYSIKAWETDTAKAWRLRIKLWVQARLP